MMQSGTSTDMPELEIQQSLQRFATQFSDGVADAGETLEQSSRPHVRDGALRRGLLYASSALEIATGPSPAINLLDMFVFVRLSRSVLERHFMREYGDDGIALREVFAAADGQIAALMKRALGDEPSAKAASAVDAWIADNPSQTRVEGLRLSDFAEAAGTAMAERSHEIRGLLSSVKSATRAATDALQIVERALFLLHRLPFLWRLQARLGAREILGDSSMFVRDLVRMPFDRMLSGARRFRLRH
jgi:hypothetical protein